MAGQQTDGTPFNPENFSNGSHDYSEGVPIKVLQGLKDVSIQMQRKYETRRHPVRGHALIFNHKKFKKEQHPVRFGTENDVRALMRTLTALKFDVKIYDDLLKREVVKVIEETSHRDHSKYDCIFVAVLSHGEGDDKIMAYDTSYNKEYLYEPLAKCETLIGKPKLFFIQACRGEKADPGYSVQLVEFDSAGDDAPAGRIPVMADILIMYPAFKGFVAYRDVNEGSIFIKFLCMELENEVTALKKKNLLTVLTNVNYRMAFEFETNQNNKQIGTIASSLTKKFYFNNKKDHVNL